MSAKSSPHRLSWDLSGVPDIEQSCESLQVDSSLEVACLFLWLQLTDLRKKKGNEKVATLMLMNMQINWRDPSSFGDALRLRTESEATVVSAVVGSSVPQVLLLQAGEILPQQSAYPTKSMVIENGRNCDASANKDKDASKVNDTSSLVGRTALKSIARSTGGGKINSAHIRNSLLLFLEKKQPAVEQGSCPPSLETFSSILSAMNEEVKKNGFAGLLQMLEGCWTELLLRKSKSHKKKTMNEFQKLDDMIAEKDCLTKHPLRKVCALDYLLY